MFEDYIARLTSGSLAQVMIIVSVIGTGTTQIVASSSSEYAINKHHDKR